MGGVGDGGEGEVGVVQEGMGQTAVRRIVRL